MVSVRVPTSNSSLLRSISACRAFCLSTSTLALLAANCASKLLRRNGTVSISIPICLILCSRSWRMSSCSKSECTCAEVIDSAERRQSLPGGLNLIEGTEDLLWPRTDGDVFGEVDADAARIEFRKPFLKTPQLGVAERSPKTAIENQRDCLRSRLSPEQIAEADGISILIQ